MSSILRVWAIFIVTAKRIISQRGLALAMALGLVTAVALTMSIPLYSDAVYQHILQEQVSEETTGATNRPPFSFMFRYVGVWSGPARWEQVWPVDLYLSGPVVNDLGIPRKLLVRYFKTDNFQLFAEIKDTYGATDKPLEWVNLAMASDFDQHIQILEGSLPAHAEVSSESQVDVLVNVDFASKLGLNVGETFILLGEFKIGEAKTRVQFPIRVAGIWQVKDSTESYWFYNPTEFRSSFMVTDDTFVNRIVPYLNDEVYLALWYMVMDGSHIHSADVPALLANISHARQKAFNLLPDTRLDISPEEKLIAYRRTASALTIFLYVFSIPLLGMTLTFIGLVVNMAVAQRHNEIAVLRSRGGTVGQLLGMAALEGVLLGLVGLGVGTPLGQGVAHIFGRVRSFLDFGATSRLSVDVTNRAIQFGLVAVLISLIAQLLPTVSASRHTIVTYKQERARQLQAPWWQRAWLDFLLLIPAVYGAYLLRTQGGIKVPFRSQVIVNDPFQNPLLMLVPALGILACTLFILRLLPFLMSVLAWLSAKTKSVGVMLATRHLARSTGFYHAPLILLVLTLSLSTFTATLAQAIDRHLHDQTFYNVGADMSVVEMGESAQSTVSAIMGGGKSAESENPAPADEEARWLFLPVSEHLKVPGVKGAARVARTPMVALFSSSALEGTFIGVDRVDFSQVAFWRKDFAPSPLGALMNNLALTTEGVLVSRDLLQAGTLKPGDTLKVRINQYDLSKELDFKVVGAFDLFPSWFPDEGPLVVGNLDYLFEQLGSQFPYDVWLKVNPGFEYTQIIEGVRQIYLRILDWKSSDLRLQDEQRRPERQGLFGLLSVGFAALALLTVIGFLLYALFSFRQRFIEMGMLRAIGLSSGQMLVFLASELAFLLLVGLAAGTGLGVGVSNLFIPYLQMGGEAARTLPLLVEIDWTSVFRIYIIFGLLFVLALSTLSVLLLRMKIFQAVKMGEAA
jgi:putative ABC transport system permease protein